MWLQGCLESYTSLNAAHRLVPSLTEPIDWTHLLTQGDPDLTAWIDEAGRALRRAIVSVENLLDPEVVFIGGTVPEPLLGALLAVIVPLPPRIASERGNADRLLRANVGLRTATLGAAALPIFAETASDLSLLLGRNHWTATATE